MTLRRALVTLLSATSLSAGLALFTGSMASAEPLIAAEVVAEDGTEDWTEDWTEDNAIEITIQPPAIETTSALDMRDDEYNTDYIFGMTKGVASSTMTPAIKPLFFLVTIPLDIVLLPFAVIGGFF